MLTIAELSCILRVGICGSITVWLWGAGGGNGGTASGGAGGYISGVSVRPSPEGGSPILSVECSKKNWGYNAVGI